MSRVAWFATIVLLTVSAAALVWRFHVEVVLFLLSMAIAAAARPAVLYLVGRGVRPMIALVLIYIVGIGGVIALVYLFGDPFLRELQQASKDLARSYESVTQQWPSGSDIQRAIAGQLPPSQQLYAALSGAQGQAALRAVLGFTAGFVNVIANLAVALVLSLYWGADYVRLERLWLSLMPAEQRAQAHSIWQEIEAGVGAYIRSELVQTIAAIILLDIGYNLLGLHYPTVLAVVGGLLWLVPLAGAVLALAPVLLVGLAQGPVLAVAAAISTLAVLTFLELVVQPRVVRLPRASSVLIVLYLIAMSNTLGLFGLVAAPPLAVATEILLRRLIPARSQRVEAESTAVELEKRVMAARATIAGMEPASPEIKSLLERLDQLIEDVDKVKPLAGSEGKVPAASENVGA
jgi:predicted PurR-regulated permease PerM